MKKILVTEENCEKVATDLVESLFGKKLVIVSFFSNSGEPKIVSGVKILSGFTFDQGRLKIPLTPRRNIFWDVSKERVSLEYEDDGTVVIKRVLGNKGTIFRVIVAF